MKRSTESFSEQTARLKAALDSADAVVIGAGTGLSTSAGYEYSGERFEKYFSDFEEKYGFHDMYSGGFYPYKTPEEFWAFWSRYIFINRYVDAPKPVYEELLKLVGDKDYFVITTNVDHCFQKAGFDNEREIRLMYEQQEDGRIPSELIPRCPHCGRPMTVNLRSGDSFVEDEGWHRAAERYENFLRTRAGLKILFLELGVGYNTPVIIKYPFWHMTAKNPKAVYACINLGEADAPDDIAARSICIGGDIGTVLEGLR